MRDSYNREADLFYADLLGLRRPRRRRLVPAVAETPTPDEDAPEAHEDAPENSISAGRVFDDVVHRGLSPEAMFGDDETWEVAALPRSATPLADLTAGGLVVQRALGERRLGSMRVLGQDVEPSELYGEDGLIRSDTLVLKPRAARVNTYDTVEPSEPSAEWSFGAFFRPSLRAASFPARPSGALGGRAFMDTIKGEGDPRDWAARENAIVAQLVSGNMPDSLLSWTKIDLAYKDSTRDLTGSVQVLPDYLAVGSDTDYVHVPLDPVSAQLVADKLDAILPTARICHAIYKQAAHKNRIGAIERDYWQQNYALRRTAKPGRAQASSAAYLEHSEAIQAKTKSAGISIGELVAGHKKDVVISKRLLSNVKNVAFHGFYDGNGYPHEPCYENPERKPKPTCDKESAVLAHHARFSDYSQGVRLVHPWMVVNGEKKKVAEVLADRNLSYLISNEGPIDPPRIPNTVRPNRGASESTLEAEVHQPTESAVTIPAGAALGTSKTVAPIADLSPQLQMNVALDRELVLIAQARIVAEWINKRFSSTIGQAMTDSDLMKRLDLSKDKTLRGKLRPFPGFKLPEMVTAKGTKKRTQLFTTDAVLTDLTKPPTDAAGLLPVFELLRFYGVVLLPPGEPPGARKVIASITRVEARLERERFDKETAAVEQRAVQFKHGVANFGIIHNCVEGELVPADWWPDQNPPLKVAKPIMALLRRLRERNRLWRAGTYASHFWNDFSVDMYITANVGSHKFWARDKMRDFFQALNAACEDEAAPGRFAWKALYNDQPHVQELNGVYGAGRILVAPGHGPGPEMHVHLDVRPLRVPFDATTGFWITRGRVVLKPA